MNQAEQVTKIHKVELGDIHHCEIMAVADLHYGDAHQDGVMIAEMKQWLKQEPNRYIVILGDIFNAALKNSVSDVYSDTMTVDAAMEAFVSQFEPIREHILGVVDGNHDQRVWKDVGVDPVKWCCHRIGVKYFGHEGLLAIGLGNQKVSATDRRRPYYYLFHLHHGFGGGMTAGANANSMRRMGLIYPFADVHLAGHTHKPLVDPDTMPYLDSQFRHVKQRGKLYIRTGACLNRDGYAVAKGFPHVSKQWIPITLHGTRRQIDATASV